MAKLTKQVTISLVCLFLALFRVSQAQTVRQYIANCTKMITQNPSVTLQMQCMIPGEDIPESLPIITLQAVPYKCQRAQTGFYTEEQYKTIQQDILNLTPVMGPVVGQNFPYESTGYWCDPSGTPKLTQFYNVTVYIGLCVDIQHRDKPVYCLVKVQPIKLYSRGKLLGEPKSQASSPGFLVTLETILLFPLFLIVCWILPFLGTILSKDQHQKWITFWILNMILSFFLVPILQWIFYSPMIMLIRILMSIALVKIIKHSIVLSLLSYVDLIHGLVKAEYSKLKEKAISMSQNVFGK